MKIIVRVKGGLGSGNYGHAGIPGKRGGSVPRSSHMPLKSSGWMEKYEGTSGEVHQRERDEREAYREAEEERDYQANLRTLEKYGIVKLDELEEEAEKQYVKDYDSGTLYSDTLQSATNALAGNVSHTNPAEEFFNYHLGRITGNTDYAQSYGPHTFDIYLENALVARNNLLKDDYSGLSKHSRKVLVDLVERSYPEDEINTLIWENIRVSSEVLSHTWRKAIGENYNKLPVNDKIALANALALQRAGRSLIVPGMVGYRSTTMVSDKKFGDSAMASTHHLIRNGYISAAYEWAKRNSGPTWDGRILPSVKKQFAKALATLTEGGSLWEESEPKGSDRRVKFSMPEF